MMSEPGRASSIQDKSASMDISFQGNNKSSSGYLNLPSKTRVSENSVNSGFNMDYFDPPLMDYLPLFEEGVKVTP